MNFVTDTHALLWWFTDSPKITAKVSAIFEKCERGENIIFVPSIVIAESEDLLSQLADEALEEHRQGKTKPLNIDDL